MNQAYTSLPGVLSTIEEVRSRFSESDPRVGDLFENCYKSNLEILAEQEDDGSFFLITGDIPAMWLRDSACQIRPYLPLAQKEPAIAALIEGVIKKQMNCILKDPYANAFTRRDGDDSEWTEDLTEMRPGIWERKYEIDSLCFPFKLAYDYWKSTQNSVIFDDTFKAAAREALHLFQVEQNHESQSPYRFQRKNCPYIDSLSRDGLGASVKDGCGLIWSGFRPSDDACVYGYLIPSNMFAVVILEGLAEISSAVWKDDSFASELSLMAKTVRSAIEREAVVPTGSARFDQSFYAYEVDGWGQYNIMDDSNFPNLLSAPYLGYCDAKNPLYIATKRRMLSEENPYYYKGNVTEGYGSIHTKSGYIWPLSLGMIGLVSDDPEEKLRMVSHMASLDAGTGLMHESLDVNDPSQYTRPLFGWANAVFCELAMECCGIKIGL